MSLHPAGSAELPLGVSSTVASARAVLSVVAAATITLLPSRSR
jgi:uncharacterized membrane protein